MMGCRDDGGEPVAVASTIGRVVRWLRLGGVGLRACAISLAVVSTRTGKLEMERGGVIGRDILHCVHCSGKRVNAARKLETS